jgi:hypothetical protein
VSLTTGPKRLPAVIPARFRFCCAWFCAALSILFVPALSRADSSWEITPQSRKALDRGLQWLARNQGPEGNWSTNHLGLVSMGLLAFLSDGHSPGLGRYGAVEKKALDYILRNAKPSGLLNISGEHHDMYNHGLSTFVLGQAYGMTSDPRVGPALDRALKVIIRSQCRDGGWQYEAYMEPNYFRNNGHDLSLSVMQAKALRSAVDSGFEIPPAVIESAIRDVREHYTMRRSLFDQRDLPEAELRTRDGRFTYNKGGGQASVAMAAAGVVCLQEFAQYDDWRIPKNIEIIEAAVRQMSTNGNQDDSPFDPYTMYYVAQALYQVGGEPWKRCYPLIRDRLIASQMYDDNSENDGAWHGTRRGRNTPGDVPGKPGVLYQTAVACFVLAIPNRYLPILQEGKIDSLRKQFVK